MDRLIIFGDSALAYSRMLTESALAVSGRVEGLRVVAVCDTGAARPSPLFIRKLRRRLAVAAAGTFNRNMIPRLRRLSADSICDTARRHNLEILVPPRRDINHPGFMETLRREYRANLALSLGCRQIFGSSILGLFEMVVNGHDGLLPEFRGLHATAWSLYRGARATGFTYHVMNEKIDGGNILLEDRMKVDPSRRRQDVIGEKMRRAGAMMEELLPLMASRDPGRPQEGDEGYYGAREHGAITTINDPSALTWEEIRRRLWAFGTLNMRLAGRTLEVTALEESGRAVEGGGAAFVTGDGVAVRATRFRHLPFPVYRLLQMLRIL